MLRFSFGRYRKWKNTTVFNITHPVLYQRLGIRRIPKVLGKKDHPSPSRWKLQQRFSRRRLSAIFFRRSRGFSSVVRDTHKDTWTCCRILHLLYNDVSPGFTFRHDSPIADWFSLHVGISRRLSLNRSPHHVDNWFANVRLINQLIDGLIIDPFEDQYSNCLVSSRESEREYRAIVTIVRRCYNLLILIVDDLTLKPDND